MSEFTIAHPRNAGESVCLKLHLDIPLARYVRNETQFDLLKPDEHPGGSSFPLIQVMHRDLEAWASVLYAMVAKQLEAHDISDDEFLAACGADGVFKASREAFMTEWVDFFRRAGVFETAAAMQKQFGTLKIGAEELEALPDEEIRSELRKQLRGNLKSVPLAASSAPGKSSTS